MSPCLPQNKEEKVKTLHPTPWTNKNWKEIMIEATDNSCWRLNKELSFASIHELMAQALFVFLQKLFSRGTAVCCAQRTSLQKIFSHNNMCKEGTILVTMECMVIHCYNPAQNNTSTGNLFSGGRTSALSISMKQQQQRKQIVLELHKPAYSFIRQKELRLCFSSNHPTNSQPNRCKSNFYIGREILSFVRPTDVNGAHQVCQGAKWKVCLAPKIQLLTSLAFATFMDQVKPRKIITKIFFISRETIESKRLRRVIWHVLDQAANTVYHSQN